MLDTTFSPPLPLPVRLGDTNLDGFPDLLVIAAMADKHTPKLLISEPCTRGLAGCDQRGRGRRGFRLLERGAESLEAVYDARGGSFIDMDEDVRSSCLVSVREYKVMVHDRGHWILLCNERARKGVVRSRLSKIISTMTPSF